MTLTLSQPQPQTRQPATPAERLADALRDWRALRPAATNRLPTGLDAWWHAGAGKVKSLFPWTRRFLRRAELVHAMRDRVRELGSGALREEADRLRARFRLGRDTRDDRHRAVAVVREVARREMGMEPYRVQVAATLAGLDGFLIEMATGEGKSLAAACIAAIAAWRGEGVHLLTVNDYLAQRDAEHFQKFYRALGVSVASVVEETEPAQRRRGYAADVTYLTNKEAAADFLRDRVALGPSRGLDTVLLDHLTPGMARGGRGQLVQRSLHQAIVDEADSILIDEAVTPLILSGDAPLGGGDVEDLRRASWLAEQLAHGEHYTIDARHRDIDLTRAGKLHLARLGRGLPGLWRSPRIRHELVLRALSAEHLFKRDQQYVVHEGKIVIVDESTGRLMPDRSWRDGLHQAVEVKEGVEVTPPKATLARVSFQRFFRRYRRLTGMTGTAMEARAEFWHTYRLPTVRIPTHRPCIRTQQPDRVFADADAKWDAVVDEVRQLHATGRPVLVGTRNVKDSHRLSERLSALGLEHAVLNAVRHAEEAAIVAKAGVKDAITVATNMAGRGTDIKLGAGVAELGGLHVVATDRHESARVDRQLVGRAGRQGDPGSAAVLVSLEDELITRYANKSWRGRALLKLVPPRAFALAQRKARSAGRSQRKGVLKQDVWLDEQLGFAGIEN